MTKQRYQSQRDICPSILVQAEKIEILTPNNPDDLSMLISAERLGRDESALLFVIPSQQGHCTDQRGRTQVETWNSVIINAQTETKQSGPGTRNWIQPRWEMPAKCFSALPDSMLPFHNNIRGCSADGEKANIEQTGQTNKNKVYFATCGSAGEEMDIGWHGVL